jgi:hypothetical protein
LSVVEVLIENSKKLIGIDRELNFHYSLVVLLNYLKTVMIYEKEGRRSILNKKK